LDELNRLGLVALNYVVQYAFQATGAVVILLLGWWVAGLVAQAARRLGERVHLDVTLTYFFAGAVRLAIIALVVIAALGNFGITVAPLIAAVGATAFGITVAIQGPLSNFGAGVVIILTRPFKVGDTISVKGVSGVVDAINLSDTILVSDDGDRISIPNKQVNGEIITNSAEYRLVETAVKVPLRLRPEQAIDAIHQVLAAIAGVAADRAPELGVREIADDGVVIGVRYWSRNRDYHQTRFAVNRGLLDMLERLGLRPPADAA
jgi:small conductance mechanosensitive channel